MLLLIVAAVVVVLVHWLFLERSSSQKVTAPSTSSHGSANQGPSFQSTKTGTRIPTPSYGATGNTDLSTLEATRNTDLSTTNLHQNWKSVDLNRGELKEAMLSSLGPSSLKRDKEAEQILRAQIAMDKAKVATPLPTQTPVQVSPQDDSEGMPCVDGRHEDCKGRNSACGRVATKIKDGFIRMEQVFVRGSYHSAAQVHLEETTAGNTYVGR